MALEDGPQSLQIVVPYRHLPPEVLISIFLRTTPPSFLLDSSLVGGPNSPWCKAQHTKMAITLVCKDWYASGIALLYEEVVIRRIRQIPALRRTLENPAERFSQFIKELTLWAVIPRSYEASVARHLKRVVDLSSRMHRLNFSSPFSLSHTTMLSLLSTSITHIHLGQLDSRVEFYDVLEAVGDTLKWFSVCAPVHLELSETTRTYELPQLEDLLIELLVTRDNLATLTEALEMPRLRRLTFRTRRYSRDGVYPVLVEDDYEMAGFTEFCNKHGRNVDFLNIQPTFMWRNSRNLQKMLNACPVLEHLVLYTTAELPVTHPTVKRVDFWKRTSGIGPVRELLTTASFPRLEQVRELEFGPATFLDVPMILSPHLGGISEGEYRFPGIYVRCDIAGIDLETRLDVDPAYGSDTSDDEDYVLEHDDTESTEYPSDTSDGSEYSLTDLMER